MVEEWDADEGAAEGREEAERGHCGGGVAGETDEGAAAGVEWLGRGERDGEERVRSA